MGVFPLPRLLGVLLLALAVLIVLGQANPLTTRLGRDSGMYAYVASHLERGNTPYVSAWEHKPPGIFFIDALGLAVAEGTRWGIWFVELVSLLIAAIVGYFGLRRFFGQGPALVASLVWLAGLSFVLEGGNFTEEFSLPLHFISLLLFGISLRRRPLCGYTSRWGFRWAAPSCCGPTTSDLRPPSCWSKRGWLSSDSEPGGRRSRAGLRWGSASSCPRQWLRPIL